MNEEMAMGFLEQAEKAMMSVQENGKLTSEQIATAREIVRMYESSKKDLMMQLWSLVISSPDNKAPDREVFHWQGMIDAFVGLLIKIFQSEKIVRDEPDAIH